MNQQAFYRDTAIGEFQLDANGFLAYRSWGKRRHTLQAQQRGLNYRLSKVIASMGLPKTFPDDGIPAKVSGFDWAVPTANHPLGMTYEERFGRS